MDQKEDYMFLYNKISERTDTYKMKINQGGSLDIKESGWITITFVDGKFKSVKYPFTGPYTRNGWRILAAIEAEISRIEDNYERSKG